MPISFSIPKFQRFFRLAAGLHVDKEDLKRFEDFIKRGGRATSIPRKE
jgi:hypothetical protein